MHTNNTLRQRIIELLDGTEDNFALEIIFRFVKRYLEGKEKRT